jgi:hypothetical protein
MPADKGEFMPRSLILILALLSTNAIACPKGAHDERLTLDQVMLNFGHFLNPADLAALKGHNNADAVTDADLANAVTGIAGAIECADAVLGDKSGDLYPPKYFRLDESARAAYLQLFLSDMDAFRQGLAVYKRDFVALQKTAPAKRDFTEVDSQRQDVDDLATTAHGDLQ